MSNPTPMTVPQFSRLMARLAKLDEVTFEEEAAAYRAGLIVSLDGTCTPSYKGWVALLHGNIPSQFIQKQLNLTFKEYASTLRDLGILSE